MGEGSSKEYIEDEAEWIDSTSTRILDRLATQKIVTARSKLWSTPEVKVKRKMFRRARRLYQ